MIIREATDTDISEIFEIEKECFTSPWPYEDFEYEVENEDSFFTVAVIDDLIVGFCIIRRTGDDGEITNIAVRKSHRGIGVGEKLLKSALDHVRDMKFQLVFLEVRQSNLAAIKLYEKYGFDHLSIRKGYYTEPDEDAITMVFRNM